MDYELADIARDHIENIKKTPHQYKVLSNIMYCRTEKMGGHKLKCNNTQCNHTEKLYNSCRDRNCPKCLGSKQLKWKHKRLKEMLPVNHNMLTYKVPRFFYDTFRFNDEECYEALNEAVRASLTTLNFTIGYNTVLHTWTQLQKYHPHIHCIIPDLKLIKDESGKIKTKRLKIDIQKLNIKFKRELAKKLKLKLKKGKINSPLLTESIIDEKLKRKTSLIHNSKTTNPDKMINYLGNYTSKVAIDNKNIKNYNGTVVTYTYRNRSNGNKLEDSEINAELFLKRFIQHILPYRFTKIRYYGFLSNNNKKMLKEIREYLQKLTTKAPSKSSKILETVSSIINELLTPMKCPCCDKGIMEIKYPIPPG